MRRTASARTGPGASSAFPSACFSRWPTEPRCSSKRGSCRPTSTSRSISWRRLIAIIAALVAFAVIPFGPAWTGDGENLSFQIAPGVDIGILYIFAISSLAVYGVILAGWSSNNKYSFIGALRSSAQLISYEIPLGLSIMGVVLAMSTLDLNSMINWQDHHVWGIFVSPVGFLIFLISAFAETNRLPFDLPESEQELVGGFHTEYSGMKFGMFFLGEYVHVINVSFMTVILFFGGWDLPFVLSQEQTGLFIALVKCGVILFKVTRDDPLHHVGPLDAAEVSLRPAHGPGLEVADSAGALEPGRHGGDRPVDSQLIMGDLHRSASRRSQAEEDRAAAAELAGAVLPVSDRRAG